MSRSDLESWGGYRARCADAPLSCASRLVGDGALVILAPHPDDETFGAAGLLQHAARTGGTVGIVAVTDGEASHRRSASISRDELAVIRKKEQERAVEALGVANARWLRLGLPDGGSGRDPRFAGAAARIAAFCEELGAGTLSAPHPDDPHPDHHAAADLALRVRTIRPSLRLLFHPIWSMRLDAGAPYRGDGLLPFRIPVDRAAKRRAIACHQSQLGELIKDDPDGFSLPDWFLEAQDAPFEIHAWSKMDGTVPAPEHFAALYAGDGDPWHVRSSPYEADKRQDNCEQLAGRRYENGLELGCGEGHLTAALLAKGCVSRMTGIDRDADIVARARAAQAGFDAASFAVGALPGGLPAGDFDLVVISEVLYFLDEADLAGLAGAITQRLRPGGDMLLVSYLGETGTPLSGAASHDLFVALFGDRLRRISVRERGSYRAELLRWIAPDEAGMADGAAFR